MVRWGYKLVSTNKLVKYCLSMYPSRKTLYVGFEPTSKCFFYDLTPTGLLYTDILLVPYTLIYYQSLMHWYTTNPLCTDTLLVPYALTHYWSLMPWHTTGPLCPYTLLVPYTLTHYWSLIPWHTTGPLCPDTLLVSLDIIHIDYKLVSLWN